MSSSIHELNVFPSLNPSHYHYHYDTHSCSSSLTRHSSYPASSCYARSLLTRLITRRLPYRVQERSNLLSVHQLLLQRTLELWCRISSGADRNGGDGGGAGDESMRLTRMNWHYHFDIARLMLVIGRFVSYCTVGSMVAVLAAAAAVRVHIAVEVAAVGSIAAVMTVCGCSLVVGAEVYCRLAVVALEDSWIAALGCGSRCVVDLLVVLVREDMALAASLLEDMTMAAALGAVVGGGGDVMAQVVVGLIGRSGKVVAVLLGGWHSSHWLPWWMDGCRRSL